MTKENFAPGQIYEALSRVQSADNFIVSDIDSDKLRTSTNGRLVNKKAVEEMEKLRKLPFGEGPERRRYL